MPGSARARDWRRRGLVVRRCARVFAWRGDRVPAKKGKAPQPPPLPRRFIPVTEAVTRRYPALAAIDAVEEQSSIRIRIDDEVTELDVDDIEVVATEPPPAPPIGSAA